MSPLTLLPFVVLIGAMFLMTRSAKKKQQQAAEMRDQMQPGTGIRTIGGMYATVKEVNEDTILLEIAPGVHAVYAKNAVGAVLDAEEFERIVHGEPAGAPTEVDADESGAADEAEPAKVLEADKDAEEPEAKSLDLEKSPEGEKAEPAAEADKAEEAAAEKTAKKPEGDSDAK